MKRLYIKIGTRGVSKVESTAVRNVFTSFNSYYYYFFKKLVCERVS